MAGTIRVQGSVILNDGGIAGIKDQGITVQTQTFNQIGSGYAGGEVFPTGTPTAFPLGEVTNPRHCLVKNTGDTSCKVGIVPSSGLGFVAVFDLEPGEHFQGPWEPSQIPYHYNPNSAAARLQYEFVER